MTARFWTLDENAPKTRITLFGEALRGLAMGVRSLQYIEGDLVYIGRSTTAGSTGRGMAYCWTD